MRSGSRTSLTRCAPIVSCRLTESMLEICRRRNASTESGCTPATLTMLPITYRWGVKRQTSHPRSRQKPRARRVAAAAGRTSNTTNGYLSERISNKSSSTHCWKRLTSIHASFSWAIPAAGSQRRSKRWLMSMRKIPTDCLYSFA